MSRIAFALVTVGLLSTGPATAQDRARPAGSGDAPAAPVQIVARIHQDLALDAGQSTTLLAVADGDATIAGSANVVVVLNGTARLLPTARVGRLYVARGVAELHAGSAVTGEVQLMDATLRRAAGAEVGGQVLHSYWSRVARGLRTFGILVGVGLSVALLLGALIAVAAAPEAMGRAASTLGGQPGRSAVAAALLWLLMPWLALYLAATVIGLPAGLGFLVFVLPTLGFLGYLVAGVWLGGWVMRKAAGPLDEPRPYLGAAVGMATLLALGVIPVIGGVVTPLAAMGGSGAILLVAWRNAEGRRARPARAPGRDAQTELLPL